MSKTGSVGSGQMQEGETFGKCRRKKEMQKKLLRHGTLNRTKKKVTTWKSQMQIFQVFKNIREKGQAEVVEK